MPVCWEPSYWIHIQSRYLYILQYYYCHNFLLTENDYSTVYPMTLNLHKGPSPTVRKAKLCRWRKYILRAEGGISCALPWKCSPLTQIRREQKNAWSSSTCLLYGTSVYLLQYIYLLTTDLLTEIPYSSSSLSPPLQCSLKKNIHQDVPTC